MRDAVPPFSVPEPDADEAVRLVIAWYGREILAERRAPACDPGRLERLIAEHRQCLEDQRRLKDAGSEERARLTALYAARLKELEGTGP
ncbi:hypothetical protein [Streptomyces luteireticuli]|uniref:hypothetical protein n=1 Tax=Streptomyces luteireticuli TaxID=173858 RepID=UPI003558DF99